MSKKFDMQTGFTREELGSVEIPAGEIRVVRMINNISGKEHIDIRKFVHLNNGDIIPTKKGVWVPIAKVSELVNILKEA